MTRLGLMAFAAALAAGCAAAQPAPSAGPWGDAPRWAGHYPTEAMPGVPQKFFDLPQVRTRLEALVGPADATLFFSYHLPSRVRLIDGYLVVNRCRLHDCPGANATLILDLSSPGMWVAFDNRDPHAFTTRWIGTSGYGGLPAAVQATVTSG